MTDYLLRITLKSDATFGRGDGVAGQVDVEVQHDDLGLPYLGGRALKGLLGAECADILFALCQAHVPGITVWQDTQDRLFGASGSALNDAILSVGAACLPQDLRAAVANDVRDEKWTRADVLNMLTGIRHQTAMDAETGAPKKNSLRSMRVILRQTVLEAPLHFRTQPSAEDLALLAACTLALRRGGTGRNRGRGRLKAELCEANGATITDKCFQALRKAVGA
jgi:hypothetical protein